MRRVRRLLGGTAPVPPAGPLVTSFGGWDALTGSVLAVCHPEWRGVRTAAYAFGDPVVETTDPAAHAEEIVAGAERAGVTTIVVHGFPPGAGVLLHGAAAAGLATRVVMHSSMAQHGAEAGEAEMMDTVVGLAAHGVVGRIGFVKAGMAEAFTALGIPATHTPNRSPQFDPVTVRHLDGPAPHVGVFGVGFWRKNVVTQLAAVALLGGTAHVMHRPDVTYLSGMRIVEHGELPRPEFLALQASTTINLYVTLSECHPMGPLESWAAGVPALMSRTSEVFRSDPWLWETATVAEADDPVAIAAGAGRLLEARGQAAAHAAAWMTTADRTAEAAWNRFVSS